jgi:hypothetical protein
MTVQVDVWLRGSDFATTESIQGITREPEAWTDEDVRLVLQGMLGAMHRRKHPEQSDPSIALRGLSWIVNPYEDGGVVIAIEITMGAAIAGPFDIDKAALETMISRVLARPVPPLPSSATIH